MFVQRLESFAAHFREMGEQIIGTDVRDDETVAFRVVGALDRPRCHDSIRAKLKRTST